MGVRYRFADFELDTSAYTLTRESRSLAIEPLVFDLLQTLLSESGRIVTRDELIARVWRGRIVSESAVSTAIKSARRALHDSGPDYRFIGTVRGRGYEFRGPVAMSTACDDKAATSGIALQPALYLRPLGATGELAQTLNARLGTVLNRIPLLRIVTTFDKASALDDPRDFRQELGVTLLLDIRLSLQRQVVLANVVLTETAAGQQCLALSVEVDRADATAELLLQRIVSRAEPAILDAMIDEMSGVPSRVTDARLLQAIRLLAKQGWHRSTFERARAMLVSVIERDPGRALAHAHLALLQGVGHRVGLLRDDPGVVAATIASADRALELDGGDSRVLGLSGCALADVGQLVRAIPILRKSIDIDPQNGHAKTALGTALLMSRQVEEAVSWLEAGMRTSPADNLLAVWGTVLALAQLTRGRSDLARQAALSACQEDDRLYMARVALAGIELATGNMAAAMVAARDGLRTKPDLSKTEVLSLLGQEIGAPAWALFRRIATSGHA